MSTVEEKILLKIEVDGAEAIDRKRVLAREIKDLKDRQDELKKSGRELSIEYQNNDSRLKALQKSLRDTNREIQLQARFFNSADGSIEQLRAQLDLLTIQYNSLSEEERDTTDAAKELAENIKSISDELKTLEGQVGNTRRNVGNYKNDIEAAANSIEKMKERMEELKIILERTDPETDKYKEAKEEFDNLGFSVQRATGRINEFGEREPKNPVKKVMDDAFESASAFVNVLQLASVVAGDNEDAQKKIAAATTAIAVAQTTANIVKSKGAILDTAELILTKAKTLAMTIYTWVMNGATVATQAFRAAIVTTGVGALVVGIGLLVQGLISLTQGNKDAAKSQEELNQEMREQADLQERLATLGNDGINSIKRQIELKKAQGATDKEIFDLQVEQLEKETELLLQQRETLFSIDGEQDKINDRIKDNILKLDLLFIEYEKRQQEKRKERVQKQREINKAIAELETENRKNIAETTKEGIDLQLALFDIEAETRRKEAEEKSKFFLKQADGEAKQAEFLRNLDAKTAKDRQQMIDDYNKTQEEENRAARQRAINDIQGQYDIALQKANNFYISQNSQRKRALLEGKITQEQYDWTERQALTFQLSTQLDLIENFRKEKIRKIEESNTDEESKRNEINAINLAATTEQIAIENRLLEAQRAIREADLENKKQLYEKQLSYALDFANSIGNVVSEALDNNLFDVKRFYKGLAILMLDSLRKVVLASIAETTAKNVATLGFFGIAKAAILTAVINSAYEIAKNQISQAAGGGTFHTKGPTLLMVGDNPGGVERVTVEPLSGRGKTVVRGNNLMQLAGGGTVYADGGLAGRSASSGISVNFDTQVLEQAFKALPAPVLKITDLEKIQGINKTVEVSATL